MANDNDMSRRDMLGTAGKAGLAAGLAALGVAAALPSQARAGIDNYPHMLSGATPSKRPEPSWRRARTSSTATARRRLSRLTTPLMRSIGASSTRTAERRPARVRKELPRP